MALFRISKACTFLIWNQTTYHINKRSLAGGDAFLTITHVLRAHITAKLGHFTINFRCIKTNSQLNKFTFSPKKMKLYSMSLSFKFLSFSIELMKFSIWAAVFRLLKEFHCSVVWKCIQFEVSLFHKCLTSGVGFRYFQHVFTRTDV